LQLYVPTFEIVSWMKGVRRIIWNLTNWTVATTFADLHIRFDVNRKSLGWNSLPDDNRQWEIVSWIRFRSYKIWMNATVILIGDIWPNFLSQSLKVFSGSIDVRCNTIPTNWGDANSGIVTDINTHYWSDVWWRMVIRYHFIFDSNGDCSRFPLPTRNSRSQMGNVRKPTFWVTFLMKCRSNAKKQAFSRRIQWGWPARPLAEWRRLVVMIVRKPWSQNSELQPSRNSPYPVPN